jgi:hypothetical protein
MPESESPAPAHRCLSAYPTPPPARSMLSGKNHTNEATLRTKNAEGHQAGRRNWIRDGQTTECPAFSMNPKTPYDGISPEVPERKEATKPKLCITTRRCREAAMDQNSTGHRAIPIGHSGFCLLTPVSRISKNEGASGDVDENKQEVPRTRYQVSAGIRQTAFHWTMARYSDS